MHDSLTLGNQTILAIRGFLSQMRKPNAQISQTQIEILLSRAMLDIASLMDYTLQLEAGLNKVTPKNEENNIA